MQFSVMAIRTVDMAKIVNSLIELGRSDHQALLSFMNSPYKSENL